MKHGTLLQVLILGTFERAWLEELLGRKQARVVSTKRPVTFGDHRWLRVRDRLAIVDGTVVLKKQVR